jgi:hypothetical protein
MSRIDVDDDKIQCQYIRSVFNKKECNSIISFTELLKFSKNHTNKSGHYCILNNQKLADILMSRI